MTAEVRFGRYQDVLADVSDCVVIADNPYGERTHKSKAERNDGVDVEGLAPTYGWWTPADVREWVEFWHPRASGWMVALSCSDLAPVYRAEYERIDRQAFAPVPCVIRGMSVRTRGDGPSSWTVYAMAARPRTRLMSEWGTLDGAYVGPRVAGSSGGRGKPPWLVEALVRDYSRLGDLVVDSCCGWGSTLTAARKLGHHAIGAEMDREAFEIADRTTRGLDPRPRAGALPDFLEQMQAQGGPRS